MTDCPSQLTALPVSGSLGTQQNYSLPTAQGIKRYLHWLFFPPSLSILRSQKHMQGATGLLKDMDALRAHGKIYKLLLLRAK